jgi:hypothetical protein
MLNVDFILVVQPISLTKTNFRFRHVFILNIEISLILHKKTGHFLHVS